MSTAVLIAAATMIAAGVVVAPAFQKWRKREPLRTSDKFRVAAALAIVAAGVAWGYQAVTRKVQPVQREIKPAPVQVQTVEPAEPVQRFREIQPDLPLQKALAKKGGAGSTVYVRQVGPTYPPITVPPELMRGGDADYEYDYEPYVFQGGAAADVSEPAEAFPPAPELPPAPVTPASSPSPPSAPQQTGGEILIDNDTVVLSGFAL